ncbi:hypothetical protein SAMN05880590_11184 [Rhizobium sp. RU35A]|uniref:hypothetical protein n=1 Tax=Rhizobium sp. RU35A TaxID=1907414 RepID=UPI0009564B2D|nr:hypothetical protein [Rhizobium sp. RU35A]SIR06422.1 hypothetical protein SAMN05880590_11184 [Rhizobium sp. RU35A]
MVKRVSLKKPLSRPAPSLSETIAAFRNGWETAMAEDLAGASDARKAVQPWAPPLEALKTWASPAGGMGEALEALRLARDEARDFDESPLIFSLVSAALGFLENRPAGARADQKAEV